MWVLILLCILALNISQANGQENSTQMYYAKLTIEESAIGNITELLRPFVGNTNLRVDHLEKTTICQSDSNGTECTCEPHHRWSDKLCKSNQECCGNGTCTFPNNSSRMCVNDSTVAVMGSIILEGEKFYDCLAEHNPEKYHRCNSKLLEEMKTVYSTLVGFDVLTISNYRVGSIVADFEMLIANRVKPQDLIDKLETLSMNLSASFILETAGIVHLTMPPNPVCYKAQHTIKCTVQEDLKTVPVWQLKNEGEVFDITDGTETDVTSYTMETKVFLKDITRLWAGEYTCIYCQKSEVYSISHKASAVMDVSLLPNIDISVVPSFPRCQKSSDLLNVTVQCETDSSNQNYNVTWKGQNLEAEIRPPTARGSGETDVYAVDALFSCNSLKPPPQLTCTVKNRCNQMTTASIDINIIYANDQFCEAEGDWTDTKAGFTAVLKCIDAAGQRRRKCQTGSEKATWESEVSACVNLDLNNVLEKSDVVDIGRGPLNGNTARVFSLLESATNNSQDINSFANLNTSVQVLLILSQKQNLQPNESATDDFLESSSNLLDKSLNKSWEANADEGNISLAEKYLSSVEQLIQMANVTAASKKKNIEVAAQKCSQGAQCTNTVFNVTIHLDSPDPGSVKTAGFLDLENYLPNNDDNYQPNSIVVSTTTEREQSHSVEIKINFQLLKPRPRNVEIKCVAWDNNTRDWSPLGCKWDGPYKEGHCICYHLSSFAILMSKFPLEVPGISEITYVGLSISVISLIISLVIETIVWSTVVKTNTLYLRHTAHVNISLCLLVADCCFLASSKPSDISLIWCKTFVVLKHFCYLSMFFWMLCLSSVLLHQAVFLFHNVSKKHYLRFSLVLGYVCPLLIVIITFLAYNNGAEGLYFSPETCWLVYNGLMKGSIHAFVIPVGIIVFINVFSMLVVIMKLLDQPKNAETSHDKEKRAAITVMRSVILLTPVFGVTWIFGFAVMLLDLTSGEIAFAVNYIFTVLNALQGLFILVTTCLGDKLTREALLNRLKNNALTSTNDSSTKLDSTWNK